MTVAERQRQEQEIYRRILPEMVEGILQNEEPVSLARRMAEKTEEVDEKLLYRWIQLTEDKLDARRRRASALLALVMWIGVIAVVGSVVGVLLGRLSFSSWPVAVTSILGGGIAVSAALRLRGVTERAYARWLEREQA